MWTAGRAKIVDAERNLIRAARVRVMLNNRVRAVEEQVMFRIQSGVK